MNDENKPIILTDKHRELIAARLEGAVEMLDLVAEHEDALTSTGVRYLPESIEHFKINMMKIWEKKHGAPKN